MYYSELVQWLWPKLIQAELDEQKDLLNNHRVRFDRNKKLPSGVTPQVAYSLHTGVEDLLQRVDTNIIRGLMEELGGEGLIEFVPKEYTGWAQAVFDSLGIQTLAFSNVWVVFQAMLPMMQ